VVLPFLDKVAEAELRPPLRVPNNRTGADHLITVLSQTLCAHGYTRLELGWEATGLLWLPLYAYLAQSPALQPFQPLFRCFNPKLVRDLKQGITLQPDTEVQGWEQQNEREVGECSINHLGSQLQAEQDVQTGARIPEARGRSSREY
jgi:hypothetical protein